MSNIKSLKFENQIGEQDAYEWLLEFSEEQYKGQFSGFDVELNIGSRWSNHSYISLASGFLGKDETAMDLIPELQEAVKQITDLTDALESIKSVIISRIGEINATGTIN
jgi:hypothetical protein